MDFLFVAITLPLSFEGYVTEWIKKKIVKGDSISLCSSKYKIYSSAIVGGIAPITTGVAFSNKLKINKDTVYCFVGDMTSETGIFYECVKYSENQDLKIKFII